MSDRCYICGSEIKEIEGQLIKTDYTKYDPKPNVKKFCLGCLNKINYSIRMMKRDVRRKERR